jgi:6-pyruvoyl-tetrahydropterin synthase
MKKYVVEVFIADQKVKQYVTDFLDIAETIADNIADDIMYTRIKEVELGE